MSDGEMGDRVHLCNMSAILRMMQPGYEKIRMAVEELSCEWGLTQILQHG